MPRELERISLAVASRLYITFTLLHLRPVLLWAGQVHNTVQTSSRVSPGSSLAAALLGVLGHPVVHPITWQPSLVLAVEVFPAQFGVLKCSRALPSGRDDSGVIAVGSVDPLALKLPVYLRHRLQPRRLVCRAHITGVYFTLKSSAAVDRRSVSYTHLTLPTIVRV